MISMANFFFFIWRLSDIQKTRRKLIPIHCMQNGKEHRNSDIACRMYKEISSRHEIKTQEVTQGSDYCCYLVAKSC